jgi:hypothetical protein
MMFGNIPLQEVFWITLTNEGVPYNLVEPFEAMISLITLKFLSFGMVLFQASKLHGLFLSGALRPQRCDSIFTAFFNMADGP